MKRVLIPVLLLALGLGVALAYRVRKFEAERHGPAGGTGSIEGTELRVTARIASRVLKVLVREGDRVKAGQLLVELDCTEPEAALAQAKAQLAQAEANARSALAQVRAAAGNTTAAERAVLVAAAEALAAQAEQSNVAREAERVRTLHATGAIASSALDKIETTEVTSTQRVEVIKANRAAAEARVSVAYQTQRAALAQAEAARQGVEAARALVARSEATVRECRLHAPRDAVVETRAYEPGEVVLPGAHVLTLVVLDEVKATFYLPNAELGSAVPNRRVTVRADAYPGQTFSGVIRRVASQAEFTPRNVQTREDRDRLVYRVEVAIPNPEHRLRPGMPVEVSIDDSTR